MWIEPNVLPLVVLTNPQCYWVIAFPRKIEAFSRHSLPCGSGFRSDLVASVRLRYYLRVIPFKCATGSVMKFKTRRFCYSLLNFRMRFLLQDHLGFKTS